MEPCQQEEWLPVYNLNRCKPLPTLLEVRVVFSWLLTIGWLKINILTNFTLNHGTGKEKLST